MSHVWLLIESPRMKILWQVFHRFSIGFHRFSIQKNARFGTRPAASSRETPIIPVGEPGAPGAGERIPPAMENHHGSIGKP